MDNVLDKKKLSELTKHLDACIIKQQPEEVSEEVKKTIIKEESKPKTKKKKKSKKNRCPVCSRKLGSFGGIECKCGLSFCGKHRYSDEHDCTFDFKQDYQNKLKKANPVVKADKIKDRI